MDQCKYFFFSEHDLYAGLAELRSPLEILQVLPGVAVHISMESPPNTIQTPLLLHITHLSGKVPFNSPFLINRLVT